MAQDADQDSKKIESFELPENLSDTGAEREVIEKVVSGDTQAYRLLVSSYYARIFALIARQVGDQGVAEELTQDVFVRAHRGLRKFEFRSSFSTWLVRIALNATNSYFVSRRYKEKKKTISFESFSSPSASFARPEDSGDCYDEETLVRLRELVGALPPIHREVLVLCDLEGRSYDEAAKILEIEVGTVRSRLNRARLRLRELFFGGML